VAPAAAAAAAAAAARSRHSREAADALPCADTAHGGASTHTALSWLTSRLYPSWVPSRKHLHRASPPPSRPRDSLHLSMAAPIGKLGKAGRAVVIRKQGRADAVLKLEKDWYCGAPGPGEVLLRVVSTSVNPVDTYRCSGAVRQQFFPMVRCCVCFGRVWSVVVGCRCWFGRGLRRARVCASAGAGQRRGGRGGADARGQQGARTSRTPRTAHAHAHSAQRHASPLPRALAMHFFRFRHSADAFCCRHAHIRTPHTAHRSTK
jgi:hypothetical protein